MKKITILLTILLILTGCDIFNKKEEPIEEVNTKEMIELPKEAFRKLENYVKKNNIKTEARNTGTFDLTTIDLGKNMHLNENSYYYVTNGDIFLHVEYIYNNKYLCTMTIRDSEDNVGSFSYKLLDNKN